MQHQQFQAVGHIATAGETDQLIPRRAQIKGVGVVGTHALLRRFKTKYVHKTSFLTERVGGGYDRTQVSGHLEGPV